MAHSLGPRQLAERRVRSELASRITEAVRKNASTRFCSRRRYIAGERSSTSLTDHRSSLVDLPHQLGDELDRLVLEDTEPVLLAHPHRCVC